MEKDLNNKHFNINSMGKKIFILMFMCMFLFNSSYAQSPILIWEFEEGTGNIAFDSSNNNHLGLLSGGANFESSNTAYGNFDVDFDNNNDYITTTIYEPIKRNLSLSIWIRPDTTQEDSIINIYGENYNMYFQFLVDSDNGRSFYFNNNGGGQTISLNTNSISTQNYAHFVLNIDFINEQLSYYENGIFINNFPISNINYNDENYYIRLGTNDNNGEDFDGDIDAFKMFDFLVNQTQVNELYNSNTITYFNEIEPEIPVIEKNIINTMSPFDGGNYTNPINFQINLNEKSTCDLYIDNNKIKTFEDTNAFIYDEVLTFEEHSYFIYCEHNNINVTNYELSEIINFNVIKGSPSQINFIISGLDFNVDDENLYLVTPCLKRVMSVGGIGKGIDKELNKGSSHYFQALQKGVASFTLSENTHEFCLINGYVEYSENGFTQDFNINEVVGVVELGEFNLPSNVTQSYSIETELIDIYDTINPKAWGKTWASIIGGIVLLILGVVVLIAGMMSGNGKIVIGGVLLCLSAVGVEFHGLVGLLI